MTNMAFNENFKARDICIRIPVLSSNSFFELGAGVGVGLRLEENKCLIGFLHMGFFSMWVLL
jgi:hypothetical protein